MAAVLKYVYIDKLDNIADEFNSTYQGTIKMKPTDFKTK